MSPSKTRYRDFKDNIDIDAFEEAIGFTPDRHKDGNDIGQCIDIWGLHSHGDRTGKFAIHRDKKVWGCWVCGGGSLLSLAMEFNDISEPDAIDWLQQFVGEKSESDEDFISYVDAILDDGDTNDDVVWPWFNERVLDRLDPAPEEWLKGRQIHGSVATKHVVRYEEEHKRTTGRGVYVGPAIILPHWWNRRLVGWQERWLLDDRPEWVPKYTNTQDFPKKYTIYNYDVLYSTLRPIVVVESVPTALFLESCGIPAVATFGSSVTPEQMRLLRLCQQGVILAPDNDPAGRKFRTSLGEYLSRYIPVWVTPYVGKEGSGDDLGDLRTAAAVLRVLEDADIQE